jgi:hypothetical protein
MAMHSAFQAPQSIEAFLQHVQRNMILAATHVLHLQSPDIEGPSIDERPLVDLSFGIRLFEL